MNVQDIIEMDGREYLVYDKIDYNDDAYFVLCPLLNNHLMQDGYIVMEKNGMIYFLEDDQDEILHLFEKRIEAK